MERLGICSGLNNKETVQLFEGGMDDLQLPDAVVEYADGMTSEGMSYSYTVRSSSCQYLTNTAICLQCAIIHEKIERLKRAAGEEKSS